jgi:succinoglycan biosynthesis protein ExoM
MRVAICVATYRRPISLERLLHSLAGLRYERIEPPEVTVVVVDNDRDRSAAAVVDAFRESPAGRIEYAVEAEPNIARARNRAVEIALDRQPDALAFIDDDEVADPRWLDELIAAQRQHAADVVFGPVLPRYEPAVQPWVVKGRFFEPNRYDTGTLLNIGWTGNALVRREVFADSEVRFDPAFGNSGGEDTHFFMRLYLTGARMVWTNDARAEELVPVSRTTVRWLILRAFRIGNTRVFCERALRPTWVWVPTRVGMALVRIGAGGVLLVVGVVRGRAAMVRALRTMFHGLGSLAGLLGFRYFEYRTIHGG